MAQKYYGCFPLDLYRLGNKESNKIDILRNRDLAEIIFYRYKGVDSKVETGKSGEICWVKGGINGGISLFDDIETAPISGKFWYKIPKDVDIPHGLGLSDSRKKPNKATHYTIFPAVDMPLDNFKLLLRQIAENVKVKAMFTRIENNVGQI
ncbi:MAG: hypothetical protein L3J70_07005 [Gammaproteobacteria bacterium]|nr:hypothetical protein [Gammaproteobacteria bacterium]